MCNTTFSPSSSNEIPSVCSSSTEHCWLGRANNEIIRQPNEISRVAEMLIKQKPVAIRPVTHSNTMQWQLQKHWTCNVYFVRKTLEWFLHQKVVGFLCISLHSKLRSECSTHAHIRTYTTHDNIGIFSFRRPHNGHGAWSSLAVTLEKTSGVRIEQSMNDDLMVCSGAISQRGLSQWGGLNLP